MPALKVYDLFISHAWRYDDYYRLVNLLDTSPFFVWRNYSVPSEKPALDPNRDISGRRLIKALDNHIRPVKCVLVISGIEVARKKWIQAEIDLALSYDKPIIVIVPRGQTNQPLIIQRVAHEIVNWNRQSIIAAIRKYAF